MTPLAEEPLRLIVEPGDPLAGGSVGLGELSGRPFVWPSRPSARRSERPPVRAGRAGQRAARDGDGGVPGRGLQPGAAARGRRPVGGAVPGRRRARRRASSRRRGSRCRGRRSASPSVEPAPVHRVCLVAGGELPPAGALLAARLRGWNCGWVGSGESTAPAGRGALSASGRQTSAIDPRRPRSRSLNAEVRPYSTSASSPTSRRFGRAPTSFSTGSPSRKTMNVGIDSTP